MPSLIKFHFDFMSLLDFIARTQLAPFQTGNRDNAPLLKKQLHQFPQSILHTLWQLSDYAIK